MNSLGQLTTSIIFPLIVYFLGAYGYTWIFHFQIARNNLSTKEGRGFVLYWLGLPGPTLAAVAVAIVFGFPGELAARIRPEPIPLVWWLVAIFTIPAIYLTAIIIHAVVSGKRPGLIFHQPVLGWFKLLIRQLGVVFSEEIGWRGLALPLLIGIFGTAGGTLVLGIVWALWHLPMFRVPSSNQKGAIWGYTFSMIAWSFIMTLIVIGSHGNILPAMAFHAAANIAYFIMDIPPEAEKIISVLLGLVTLLVLFLLPGPLLTLNY